jgi:esterase/lipase superfamily enzyme
MCYIRSFVTISIVTCLLALLPSMAMADLQVVESNTPLYLVGTVVPDDTVFNLKVGERVKVRLLPGNETRLFEGAGRHSLSEPKNVERRPRAARRVKDCIVSGQCTPITVFFGTDRTREDTERHKSFGAGRGRELELGSALLTVPKSHGRGQVERPLWDFFKEDPTKHFVIAKDGVTIFSSVEDFIARIKAERGTLAAFNDHAFVFVHGFNVTFEGALYRTAQIAYDLGTTIDGVHAQFGVPFAFSWPSKGSLTAYGADEDSARISVARLKPFLKLVVENSGAKNVHVIAHSMGNQIVLRTLQALALERPDIRFNQIVLAAPDVDRDEFEEIAKSVSAVAQGVTLYASSTDVALNVSKRFRAGQIRAGDVGDTGPAILPGVDSIDISAASTDFFALNHDVYVAGPVLANDIAILLSKGLRPPNERTPLFQQRGVKNGHYWLYAR